MSSFPNYLCYASMIKTAAKLGLNPPYLSLADDIIDSHNMPEPVFLCSLERAAFESSRLVFEAGKEHEADIIASDILTKLNNISNETNM